MERLSDAYVRQGSFGLKVNIDFRVVEEKVNYLDRELRVFNTTCNTLAQQLAYMRCDRLSASLDMAVKRVHARQSFNKRI